MDLLNFLKKRRVAYDFSGKKIGKPAISRILEAARWTPSAHNSQPWKFIALTNENLIDKIMTTAYYGEFHTNPPLIVAIAATKEGLEKEARMFGNKIKGRDNVLMSIGAAAMQMIVESESLDIKSCILTPNEKTAKRILGIYKDELPLLVGFGYEPKNAVKKGGKRKALKDVSKVVE